MIVDKKLMLDGLQLVVDALKLVGDGLELVVDELEFDIVLNSQIKKGLLKIN